MQAVFVALLRREHIRKTNIIENQASEINEHPYIKGCFVYAFPHTITLIFLPAIVQTFSWQIPPLNSGDSKLQGES